jgi:alpha-N-arabinofuranosidase
MTNIAQMINVLQAMILTDKEKMVLTPTYHVYNMYVPFQDATSLPVSFDAGTYRNGEVSLPRIDAMGARGADGKLWLALVNLDPNQATQISVHVAGVSPKSASGSILTAPSVNSVNSFDAPKAVAPKPLSIKATGKSLMIELPAKSVTVLEIAG